MSRATNRRRIFSTLVTSAVVAGAILMSPSAANAGPYRSGCHAWAHSTSAFTSGVTAKCSGGPTNVQYRVVGLCVSRFTGSSRWVYGWWMNTGLSHYGCGRTETAGRNPYYQTR